MKAAEAAAILETKYFVVHPGPEKTAFSEHERISRLQNAVGALDQIRHRCNSLGVELVLENMLPHLFAGRTENLIWIMKALTTADVGICLDTGHAQLGCNLPEIMALSAACLRLVHANDNHGTWDDHFSPGDGKIDWSEVMRQLLDIRYDGALIVEVANFDDRRSTLKQASRGREHLRQIGRTLEPSMRGIRCGA